MSAGLHLARIRRIVVFEAKVLAIVHPIAVQGFAEFHWNP
jgi:hypothetical protein